VCGPAGLIPVIAAGSTPAGGTCTTTR
jgi:hypothetical protein